jgi:hypothetical protein
VVYILRGDPVVGLSGVGASRLAEGDPGVDGTPQGNASFTRLAVTRANDDEFDDLIVGAPGDNGLLGSVHVLLGSPSGIATSGNGFFQQGVGPIIDPFGSQGAGAVRRFGWSVGGTSDGVVLAGADVEDVISSSTAELVSGAGTATFIQLARTPDLAVDGATTTGGLFYNAVAQLTQELFTLRPTGQTFTQFINGTYKSDPFEPLFNAGVLGDIVSRARPGLSGAPPRRRSTFGAVLSSSRFPQSGGLRIKVRPGTETGSACVHATRTLDIRDRGHVTVPKLFSSALQIGNDARVTGDVFVTGNGTLGDRSFITGNAALEGHLRQGSLSAVTGTLRQDTILNPLFVARHAVTPGTKLITVPNDRTSTIFPGAYGAVEVQDRATGLLSAGTYSLASLQLRQGKLIVDTSRGNVTINVSGSIQIADRARISVTGGGVLAFYSNDTGTLRIGTDTQITGTFTVPSGQVLVSSRTVMNGCIAADSVTIEPDAQVSGR